MQDVYLARAQRDRAQDALRQAEGGRKQAQRALEILVGRYPSAEIEGADELSPVPSPIPVGQPRGRLGATGNLLISSSDTPCKPAPDAAIQSPATAVLPT